MSLNWEGAPVEDGFSEVRSLVLKSHERIRKRAMGRRLFSAFMNGMVAIAMLALGSMVDQWWARILLDLWAGATLYEVYKNLRDARRWRRRD